MLGVKTYSPQYIGACREKVRSDLAALSAANVPAELAEAFLGNLVVVLDAMFVHRLRTVEGKDGNPANEVRVVAQSLLDNGGAFTGDKAIKLAPGKSVLGLQEGEQIRLTPSSFEKLAEAYFDEIERKFGG